MRRLRWLVCLLAGHRWRFLRVQPLRAMYMSHLHSLCGFDADCGRCGEQWRDVSDSPSWGDVYVTRSVLLRAAGPGEGGGRSGAEPASSAGQSRDGHDRGGEDNKP